MSYLYAFSSTVAPVQIGSSTDPPVTVLEAGKPRSTEEVLKRRRRRAKSRSRSSSRRSSLTGGSGTCSRRSSVTGVQDYDSLGRLIRSTNVMNIINLHHQLGVVLYYF